MEDAILSVNVKCTLVLHLARATCDREYVTLSNLPYERERERVTEKTNKSPKHNNKTKILFLFVFALDLVGIINQSINQISIASNKSIDEVKYGY